MLPFVLKVIWFGLSCTGLLGCWVVFGAFGRAFETRWGPLLYCLGNTLLQLSFCLGIFWDMSPPAIPKALCIGQSIVNTVGSLALVGTMLAISLATYTTARKPKTWGDIRKAFQWQSIFIAPILGVPVVGSTIQAILLVKFNAVQPTDGMMCDPTHPEWFRFLGFAGLPFLISIVILTSSIRSMLLIRKTQAHLQRSRSFAGPEDTFTTLPPPPRARPRPRRQHSSTPTGRREFSFVRQGNTPVPADRPATIYREPIRPAIRSPTLVAQKFHLPFRPSQSTTTSRNASRTDVDSKTAIGGSGADVNMSLGLGVVMGVGVHVGLANAMAFSDEEDGDEKMHPRELLVDDDESEIGYFKPNSYNNNAFENDHISEVSGSFPTFLTHPESASHTPHPTSPVPTTGLPQPPRRTPVSGSERMFGSRDRSRTGTPMTGDTKRSENGSLIEGELRSETSSPHYVVVEKRSPHYRDESWSVVHVATLDLPRPSESVADADSLADGDRDEASKEDWKEWNATNAGQQHKAGSIRSRTEESADGGYFDRESFVMIDEQFPTPTSMSFSVNGIPYRKSRRPPVTLSPAVCHMIIFQMTFSFLQFLAFLSTFIDLVTRRPTPSPFGTHHVSLLLSAWCPIFIFCHLPSVRRNLIPWRNAS